MTKKSIQFEYLQAYSHDRCRKPPSNVPYKGTYVPYKRTFGMPDQGQTLDVWGGIQQISTLR
jgi:hypothetical protein